MYTATDLHTYAVTAGHCRSTAAGYARDQRSGHTGGFIRAIVDLPSSGGADYGLIDFGIRSLPLSFIGDNPYNRRPPTAVGGPSNLSHRSVQRPTLRPHHRRPRR